MRKVQPAQQSPVRRLRAHGGALVRRALTASGAFGLAVRARWLQARAASALAGRERPFRLCLGSGDAPIPGWLNVDLSPGADLRLDLRFGIPLPDTSVELIYSEHVIEHLCVEDGWRLMVECRRLLAPGGCVRVATPDLADVVTDYPRTWRDHDFLQWPEYSWVDSPARLVNLAFHGWGHRYLYDFDELALRLRQAGFTDVRRCGLGESTTPALTGMETRRDSRLVVEARVGE